MLVNGGDPMGYKLKNHMEQIVEKAADHYIAQTDMCSCEKCRMDVMALALNKLPPVYVVTDIGGLFASIDSTFVQNQIDAEVAVLSAIELVRAAPKHH
jgi:competence protein ComFB